MPPRSPDAAPLRLAELMAALSIATDFGMGQPLEFALQSCVLAMRLGEKLGFSARDLSQWVGMLAADFTAEYPGAPALNREQARQYNDVFLPAFPDLRFDVIRTIANGECVVTHWSASGTHTGPLATLAGQVIPPTGRKGTVRGVLITEIKDGKIASERTYWDQVSLLTQLGLMPGA